MHSECDTTLEPYPHAGKEGYVLAVLKCLNVRLHHPEGEWRILATMHLASIDICNASVHLQLMFG